MRVYTRAPLEDRFWSKVLVDDGCWNWTGARNKLGYGTLETTRLHSRKVKYAHRLSWELASGADPGDLKVCHRCDNPSCVRPSHLFLGTQTENLADMRAKGRGSKPPAFYGEQNTLNKWRARLASA